MRKLLHSSRFISLLVIALVFGLIGGFEVLSSPAPTVHTALAAPAANGTVKRIVYFNTGVITPVSVGGTVTPTLNSAPVCGLGSASIYRADVIAVGTMTGTAPTLAPVWQNSIDGGVHWTTVGSFTTINATVTPASQSQTVSDIVGATAVAYGDCWRMQLTFGGTGAVGANLAVIGYAK